MAATKRKKRPEADKPPRPERRERRSLSHVGGRVEKQGADPRLLAGLESALSVTAEEESTLAHVHGFHSYPARLHPETAARLIEGLSDAGDVVLDPFCGSGTVLVEARRLGRKAWGLDANPLAIELSWLKTRRLDPDQRAELLEAAERIVDHAEARRTAKAGPTHRYGPPDRELFDVHVLLELDGLRDGIKKLVKGELQRALWLVLSAILTKASKKPGDTTSRTAPRRLASGFVIRLFEKKTQELARRLGAYAALVPKGAPEVNLAVGDARQLEPVRDASVNLIVTSPPYPGVYDYYAHHEVRLRWLGLDARQFDKTELGARRHARSKDPADMVEEWRRDFGACLAEMRRVLLPRGSLALVIADSVIGGIPLRADITGPELASRAGLELVARASQARPHFHLPTQRAFADGPRREHVLVFRPATRRRYGFEDDDGCPDSR